MITIKLKNLINLIKKDCMLYISMLEERRQANGKHNHNLKM